MSGADFLVDTNFAIYFLEGHPQVQPYQEDAFAVSVITELELLSKPGITLPEVATTTAFLNTCLLVDLTPAVKAYVLQLRQQHRLKLPDAIVAASAQWLRIRLITADKSFAKVLGLDLILLNLS